MLAPDVNVALPSSICPTPAMEPTVSANPSSVHAASASTVKAELSCNTPAAPLLSVPALTRMAPVNALAPDRVKTPVPTFVRPPAPDIAPLKVVLAWLPPAVKVALPRVMLPAPAMEPTVSAKPFRSQVAEFATVTAVPSCSTPAAPLRKVPAFTAVLPVKPLAADKVKAPAPALIKEAPVPLMTPL